MRHRDYRADVDGLRAVAVMLVLLFHLNIPWIPGGYVGVDIFFVISGYLITQIIFRELDQENFSIIRFYERRIRRIFPALFAMMALVFAVCWFVFLPIDFKNFGQSVAAATLFASNFLFIFESGYFDADAELKPLLHTWSLAVEEQFYVIFPLAMILIWHKAKSWLLPILVLTAVVSFGIALFATDYFPVTGFFVAPSRFWELLLGSVLALDRTRQFWPWQVRLGGWLGLAMIALAALSYTPHTPFPGWAALLPCLGAALIIKAGETDRAGYSANAILALKPMVFVGLISYSLYLWHWPLIVIYKYVMVRELAVIDQFGLAAVSIGLAIISWRWIEQPFRDASLLKRRTKLIGAAFAVMGVAVAVGVVIAKNGGIPSRVDPALAAIERDQLYVGYVQDCRQGLWQKREICVRGTAQAKPSFLLLGDSHAGSISSGVFAAARSLDQAGVQLTVPSYRPFLDFGRRGFERIDMHVDRKLRLILREYPSIRTIIIIAHWRQASEVGYQDLLSGENIDAGIIDLGLLPLIGSYKDRQFVIIRDYPIAANFGANKLARRLRFGRDVPDTLPRAEHDRQSQPYDERLQRLAINPNVIVTDLDDVFCDSKVCISTRQGRSLYRDSDHLSLPGALMTADFFKDILDRH